MFFQSPKRDPAGGPPQSAPFDMRPKRLLRSSSASCDLRRSLDWSDESGMPTMKKHCPSAPGSEERAPSALDSCSSLRGSFSSGLSDSTSLDISDGLQNLALPMRAATQFVPSLELPPRAFAAGGGGSLPAAPAVVHASTQYATPTRCELNAKACEEIDLTALLGEFRNASVKCVILDLDMTILSIHTKGVFSQQACALSQHIRPVFRAMIPQLLLAGIPVGVATFSPQEKLVEDMLRSTFPGSVKLGANCFVRGYRPHEGTSQAQEHQGLACFGLEESNGKRRHIKDILHLVPDGRALAPRQVLFVDDDQVNVDVAFSDGHRVVRYLNQMSDNDFMAQCLQSLRQP
jgi:hypothetical protein